MPLEFLKRRGRDGDRSAPPPAAVTEDTSAQEYVLKLYYAGKSSEGVRLKAGPRALAELPSMLAGLATDEIEVIEPLPIEFSQASPQIIRLVRGHAVGECAPRPLASRAPLHLCSRVDRRD